MDVLRIVLTVVFIIVSVVIAGLVLMQEGKSAGLGSIAGVAETYWGKNKGRSMEGVLIKTTAILGALFIVLAIVMNLPFF